jgi:hypothetical protein
MLLLPRALCYFFRRNREHIFRLFGRPGGNLLRTHSLRSIKEKGLSPVVYKTRLRPSAVVQIFKATTLSDLSGVAQVEQEELLTANGHELTRI